MAKWVYLGSVGQWDLPLRSSDLGTFFYFGGYLIQGLAGLGTDGGNGNLRPQKRNWQEAGRSAMESNKSSL